MTESAQRLDPAEREAPAPRRSNAAAIKFGVFVLFSALVSGYLAIVLGNLTTGPSMHYSALFAHASSLEKGAPVRIAGVSVGAVDSVAINNGGSGRDAIKVDFHVDSGVGIPADAEATIRFKNLIGDQYLQLDPGTTRSGVLLHKGGVIPSSRTRSALDLDTLFNGFQPLLQGLDTAEINQLSTAVVNVLQGQAGAVYQLIGTLSSLFTTLADNDQLIGQVISNLDTGLSGVAENADTLSTLVKQLEGLVTGLSADRKPIGRSLVQINALAASAASLIERSRPALRNDVPALQGIATQLNKDSDSLQRILTTLPPAYDKLMRTGSYGGFFNFYLCGLRFKLTGPDGPLYSPWTYSGLERCKRQ